MNRCPRCMSGNYAKSVCPDCGYQPDGLPEPEVLPEGMTLRKRYRLGIPLAQSRQALFYAAWDLAENRPVIAEEFFPNRTASRDGAQVVPQESAKKRFETARDLFLRAPKETEDRPLDCADAFTDHGTGVRVYPSRIGELEEDAEKLMNAPILFRGADGMPLMTINALRIPALPEARQPRTRAPLKRNPESAPPTPRATLPEKQDGDMAGLQLILLVLIVVLLLALCAVLVFGG